MEEFINDKLHDILGLSDFTTVQYIKSVTQKSRSLQDLKQSVIGVLDFPKDKQSDDFIRSLFEKFSPGNQKQRRNIYQLKELRKIA